VYAESSNAGWGDRRIARHLNATGTMTDPNDPRAPEPVGRAGTAIGRLIDEQLAEERSRKTSLEARGLSVITTSGVLVTLILGFGGLVKGDKGLMLPGLAKFTLVGGLIVFVLAAAAGLYVNTPLAYVEVRAEDLRVWLEPRLWEAQSVGGEVRAAEARVEVLAAARALNDRKAIVLVGAIGAEVVAIALLAVTVGVIVLDAA
jgi:hypothetical protein